MSGDLPISHDMPIEERRGLIPFSPEVEMDTRNEYGQEIIVSPMIPAGGLGDMWVRVAKYTDEKYINYVQHLDETQTPREGTLYEDAIAMDADGTVKTGIVKDFIAQGYSEVSPQFSEGEGLETKPYQINLWFEGKQTMFTSPVGTFSLKNLQMPNTVAYAKEWSTNGTEKPGKLFIQGDPATLKTMRISLSTRSS